MGVQSWIPNIYLWRMMDDNDKLKCKLSGMWEGDPKKHIQPVGCSQWSQGIVMRRSAREMDSRGAHEKLFFFSRVDMLLWKFDMDIHDCCIFKEWPFSNHHSLSNVYVCFLGCTGVYIYFSYWPCMYEKTFYVSSDSFLALLAVFFRMSTFITL